MIHELCNKFVNVHYNYLSNVQSLPQDLLAILSVQYLNYIKLKGLVSGMMHYALQVHM